MMKKNSKFMMTLMLTLVSSLSGLGGYAQSASDSTFTLAELFRLADEESSRIEVYRTAQESATEAVSAARAARLPELNVSLSASYIGDGWLSDRHYRHGMNIDMPHFGNNFALTASQPLYAGGAISSGIRLAELGQQMAVLDLQQNRQDVRLQLTQCYLSLYKLRNQEAVIARNIDLVQEVLRNMQSRLAQGVVLHNDITRYELLLETLQLQQSRVRDAAAIVNHQLVSTLHLGDEVNIVPDTTMLDAALPSVLSQSEWQQQAAASNAGLQQAQLARDMSRQQLRLERSARLPKVAVVAEDHLDGPILVEVPTINSNFNYWFVGIGIQYNISSLYKNNHSVRKAKLDARRADEEHSYASEQIEQAVQAQYTNYLTAYTELQTREKNVQLANEHYDVVQRRYENELALLTELLDADNMKLTAELDLVNARVDLIGSYYQLRYITNSL
jgi:outer membrane protein TolC